jgi:Ca-activated chloride channel family protein
MKPFIGILFFLLAACATHAQYYLRGEIRDERGRLLEGVRINLYSRGSFPYYSGNAGTFGISTVFASDTLSLHLDGYEPLRLFIDTRKFQNLVMKMLPTTAQLYSHKLASLTTNLKADNNLMHSVQGESYSNQEENVFVPADKYPETGFALNIDKASYSNIRRFLNNEMMVPADAVRIEEMLNYFQLSTAAAGRNSKTFGFSSQLTTCPWEEKNRLLFLNLKAPMLDLDSIPASNLVFLIDISGSMDKPNRLPLLQSAFKMLTANLRSIDTLTIVTYGGGVGVALPPTGGDQKRRINEVIDSLVANGDTPGEGAIRIAYDLARKNFIRNGNNRVILATDGDFNIGQTTERELEDLILSYKQTGIYLTCLGVGMGNYKDSKLEALSKKGNGNFAYIDNLQEAQKILVKEFTQTLYAVANNAFLKIRFAPGTIAEYRLIGFDNKKNAVADSSSELEGGEVGSGHSMMAIFEIKPRNNEPAIPSFAKVSLEYKQPVTGKETELFFSVPYHITDISKADTVYRFAAAVAMFGAVLKQSVYINHFQPEDVLNFIRSSINPLDMQQAAFISLLEKAARLYQPQRKKKKE